MLDYPFTNALAVLIMNKRTLEALPAAQQQVIRSVARTYARKLVELTRRDNLEARKVLQSQGVAIVQPTAQMIQDFEKYGQEAVASNIPGIFSQATYDRVQRMVQKVRSQESKKSTP